MTIDQPIKQRTVLGEDKWYESEGSDLYDEFGCKISNDPPSTKKGNSNSTNVSHRSYARLKTCNVTQIMCSSPSDDTNKTVTTKEIEVMYEYELHYNTLIDLSKTIIPYLEESILEHLASTTGVSQCRRRQLRRQANKSRLRRIGESDQNRYIGVNMQPYETINPTYTTCKYSVSLSNSNNANVGCVPMLGGVTVLVRLTPNEIASNTSLSNDDQQLIRDTITSYIHDAMDNDVFVVPTSIEKLVYVENNALEMNGSSSTSSSNLSSATIGWMIVLLIIAAILLCCCCLCCCCRKRCRRRRDDRGRQETNVNDTLTIRSIIQDTNRNNNSRNGSIQPHSAERSYPDNKGGLASLDALALKDGNDIETILVHDPTDSDSTETSTVASNRNSNIIDTNDISIVECNNDDDHSEELIGQKVVELMEEQEAIHQDEAIEETKQQVTDNDVDEEFNDSFVGSSLIETMSEEMDLLDRLALQGRPPTYPTTTSYKTNSDFLMVTPSRSLSPTTISATSQSPTVYSNSTRNIVGSPTTCSQTTMPAGNLRYNSGQKRLSKRFSSITKQSRFHSNGSIRTAYTPDSFDEEILGITSDDSRDMDVATKNTTTTLVKDGHLPQQIRTLPDVLDGHEPYINEDDDEYNDEDDDDDIVSYQSQNPNQTTKAVQRNLQMS
jgi:hypothetical protein